MKQIKIIFTILFICLWFFIGYWAINKSSTTNYPPCYECDNGGGLEGGS